MMGGFKANIFSVFFTFQAWCEMAGVASTEIEDDLTRLVADILLYLRCPP